MSNMAKLQDLYTAKLTHYNAWLMDNTRPCGQVYPGFPGDAEIQALSMPKATRVVTKAKPAKLKTQPTGAKAVKATKTGTKLEQAKSLFKANSGLSRAAMIELFMDKLSMSKAGATTYVYNCKK